MYWNCQHIFLKSNVLPQFTRQLHYFSLINYFCVCVVLWYLCFFRHCDILLLFRRYDSSEIRRYDNLQCFDVVTSARIYLVPFFKAL